MLPCNDNWQFSENWSEEFLNGEGNYETIRLPHTCKEVPYHYIDDKSFQMICGYRKRIECQVENKRVFLNFEAAGHIATVYVDKQEVLTHLCGYTAFKVELTDYLAKGYCDVAVKLDTTENPSVPPFGFVIDYLTYGGIYRPVSLEITPMTYVTDLYVAPTSLETVEVFVSTNEECEKHIKIVDDKGMVVANTKTTKEEAMLSVKQAKVWNLDNPYLYTCVVEINGEKVKETKFGFRTVKFEGDSFLLNGKKTFIRGLNRHQSYPYVGYAVSDSLQREDARILKEELACNAVRTSHYPQSQAFIDECDKLGLMVFTEIPGWQHIGDEAWKEVAIKNVEEMITQYRNHPSIILWGVRINESEDDDALYTKTNELAHKLDPYRQTGGVRCIKKSNLLEDVYTMNDFSHTGDNPGVNKKKNITPDLTKPLMVTEAVGHMYPTKSFDKWEIRLSHALRHARVQNDALADGEHVGCFTWCMFDYPTHKDFGSGDRVCYHGVLDGFRNPKLAASAYASQGDKVPILEVGSSMDIGDYPGGMLGEVYVFTNADEVNLYKNDNFVKTYNKSEFTSLKHGPLKIDDMIGELLKSQEGFDGDKEKIIHELLVSCSKYGIEKLPLVDMLKMAYAMAKYKLEYKDAYNLYGKYVGNWGGEAIYWRFDAIKDGKVVLSKTISPSSKLHLEVKTSSTKLIEENGYDMAAIRIRILDEFGNIAPYAQLPISYEVSGDIALVGPSVSTAEGGMTGTYVKSVGKEGNGCLKISCNGLETVAIDFEVVK